MPREGEDSRPTRRAALSLNFSASKPSADQVHSLDLILVTGDDAGDSTFLILDHELRAAHPPRLAMLRQGHTVDFTAERMATILSLFLGVLDTNLYKILPYA
jgi:hypothetical protein